MSMQNCQCVSLRGKYNSCCASSSFFRLDLKNLISHPYENWSLVWAWSEWVRDFAFLPFWFSSTVFVLTLHLPPTWIRVFLSVWWARTGNGNKMMSWEFNMHWTKNRKLMWRKWVFFFFFQMRTQHVSNGNKWQLWLTNGTIIDYKTDFDKIITFIK